MGHAQFTKQLPAADSRHPALKVMSTRWFAWLVVNDSCVSPEPLSLTKALLVPLGLPVGPHSGAVGAERASAGRATATR
jgi:hypothetical protein